MLQTAWAVTASQQYLFIYLHLLFLINITVNESFMPVVGQHPLSPFPYPRFYCWAWHHVLCKTLWPAQVIPQKTYNLLTVGAGGRRGTETKNLNNTCPATKQNLSHLGLLLQEIISTPARPSANREGWLDCHRCVHSSLTGQSDLKLPPTAKL